MAFEAGQFSFNTKVKLVNGTRGSAAKIQKVIVFLLTLLEHPERKVNFYSPKETFIMVRIYFKLKKKGENKRTLTS